MNRDAYTLATAEAALAEVAVLADLGQQHRGAVWTTSEDMILADAVGPGEIVLVGRADEVWVGRVSSVHAERDRTSILLTPIPHDQQRAAEPVAEQHALRAAVEVDRLVALVALLRSRIADAAYEMSQVMSGDERRRFLHRDTWRRLEEAGRVPSARASNRTG